MIKNKNAINAIYLGVLCSVAYLAVYIARNTLSAVTPQMIENGFNEVYIGRASSIYFIFYAIGQLINGAIGDKIKAKYMMCIGLFMAGVTNIAFVYSPSADNTIALYVYGITGFFLSMIYGPMTKVVSENTEHTYAVRCSLGYTFSSFLGSPVAGVAAAIMVWQSVFLSSSYALWIMAVVCFVCFGILEKKGVVTYNKFDRQKGQGGGVRLLIKRRIIKFTIVSVLTGVIRTTVVFWMPTYISQHLMFSSQDSALIFTVSTLAISSTAFITVFIYEKLKSNMDLTLLLMFGLSALFFLVIYFVKIPLVNIVFLTLGIMAANGASTMLWSIYCTSLSDTGMVSGATGYLDFMSYMAAAVSSSLFANAVSDIGWSNLILIWCGLMVIGTLISIPKTHSGADA